MKHLLLVAAITVSSAFGAGPVAAQGSAGPSPLAPPGGENAANAPPGPNSTEASAASAVPAARQLYEHVRRGIVVIERNGAPTAIGTVLAGDGRILTSLSGLGGAEGVEVRYADGTAVHAKVAQSDAEVDLALLVPASSGRKEGLRASEADPDATEMRAMLPGRGSPLGPTPAGVKGRIDAHARGGAPLLQVLDVDVRGPAVAGAPLLDPLGNVVAVLVRACRGLAPQPAEPPVGAWPASHPPVAADDASCQPVVVGAPVSAVRSFLSRAPAPPPAGPWLGIRGESEPSGSTRGVRVVAVAPSSPAEKAGLRPADDVVVAVDGQPIDSSEKLGEALAKHAVGESVKLLVLGSGKFREVGVVLRPAP